MTGRSDLSIGQRLAIGFGLLFAVVAGLLAAVLYWNDRSAAAQAAFAERSAPLAAASRDLEGALLRTGIAVRGYVLNPSVETRQGYERRIEEVRRTLERLALLPKQGDAQTLYAQAMPLVRAYLSTAAGTIEQFRAGMAPSAEIENALARARAQAVDALDAFSTLQRRNAESAMTLMQSASQATADGVLFAGALALLLFALLAALIARSIRGPAQALLGVAGALEAGNWQPALAWAPREHAGANSAQRDEMLKIGQAFGAAAAALERREQRLSADRQVAGAAASSLDTKEITSTALGIICDHAGAEVGAFYCYEEEHAKLRPLALRALPPALPRLALGEGIPGEAAQSLRTIVVRDIPADTAFSVRLGYDAALPKCVVAVPVVLRGTLLGVLLVASLRDLDADRLAFLEAAASQLAIGLENAKAYDRIRHLLRELEEKSELLQAQNEELQAQAEEIQSQNEELQAQGEEIQAQNGQLRRQTEQARAYADSLADADQRKNEFLGVLAHELRNPLAAISNALHTLRLSSRPEHRRLAEEVLNRQSRLLARLVDDLLDVTRIASGKVRLQRDTVDLARLVAECTADYRSAAEAAGVRLELELPSVPLSVDGDGTRLMQIAGNLVDNAIKFSDGKGEVRVVLAQEGGEARLSVIDAGVGMDEALLERLFQPFSQAETGLARRKGGLGLGLALAKALVELHGGSIRARSDGIGKGAELVVSLPLVERRPGVSEAALRRAAADREPRRILIVEDNRDAGLTLRDAMQAAGHEVHVAEDAEEGLARARALEPDVLLCDIGLPGMDGYELARKLRTEESLRSVFLIALTGYATPEDQQKAAQAGFDRHFGKPADFEALRQLLAEVPLRSRPSDGASAAG